MLAHALRERTQLDCREKIDGEARVLGVISGHETAERIGEGGIVATANELCQPHTLGQVLKENLDEHATATGGLLLVQMNVLENNPVKRIRVEQVRKQARHIADLVRIQAVHNVVLHAKQLLKRLLVNLVEPAESLGKQAEELDERALLAAALNNHAAYLGLDTGLDHLLQQLVCTLLVVQTRHDCQIDVATKRHQIELRLISYHHFAVCCCCC